MSGPYRFQQDSTRSPLERPSQNIFPTGQAPSFKTNVNRMKTKKWVEAKKNAYDGDDWGEYDEYDEYGTEAEAPPLQQQAPAGYRQPGQGLEQPYRSFTDPQRQGAPQPARRNSFEAGEERRAFSTSTPQPPHNAPYFSAPAHQPYAHQAHDAPRQMGNRQASGAQSESSDTPQHRRDFSPSAMPPPLHTKISPVPGSATGSPAQSRFPPRKSSIGQTDSPVPVSPSSSTKPLPFIRPADIYRRVEEERQRERASMESSRPSLDSLMSRPKEESTVDHGLNERGSSDSLRKTADASRTLLPLETVAERRSEYLPDFNVAQQVPAEPLDISGSVATVLGVDQQPLSTSHKDEPRNQGLSQQVLKETSTSQLSPVAGDPAISEFDNEFWSSGPQLPALGGQSQAASSSGDRGLRAVVDQAFTRTDDQHSMPPTPISKQTDSEVSRSNTGSSGISPIMSRVPSSAAAALKIRNNAGTDGSTPVIVEEASGGNTPVSGPTSSAVAGGSYHIARKPSPSHSRNVSNSSMTQTGLATPSSVESPARSPAIESRKFVPEPESARYNSLSPASPEAMVGVSPSLPASYATREADIASAMKTSPEKAVPELRAAEKESQTAFLESHQHAQSPLADTAPRSRSESPSKGRVQELAGKFGEVSQSRRGSTQSNMSRNSVQSWERSQENSRPSSPTKPDITTERPAAAREASFRPKLPGQWESYATTAPGQSEQGESDTQREPTDLEAPRTSSPLNEIDITPTTAKNPVVEIESSAPNSGPLATLKAAGNAIAEADPLASLKAAGAAMGEAIQASVGLHGSASDMPHDQEEQKRKKSVGEVYLQRPIYLDRAASSVASSIPPTPPAKDSPVSEDLPLPPPLKKNGAELNPFFSQQIPLRPKIVPQLSTEPSEHDLESDRLRKEIVASLSPLRASETSELEQNRSSLYPNVPSAVNRESSILPSEYDSYWADKESPRPSHDFNCDATENPLSSPDQSPVSVRSDPHEKSLLTRFSWENNSAGPQSSETQTHPDTVTGLSDISAQEQKVATPKTREDSVDSAELSAGFPDHYFGPAHTVAAIKPDLINESEITVRSPTPDSQKRAANLVEPKSLSHTTPATGLHVVNSEINPEAVDIPPRLSIEASRPNDQPQLTHVESATSQSEHALASTDSKEPVTGPIPGGVVIPEPISKDPTTDKPLGFRDIANIKSASERVVTYNNTRDYWANADHGLNDWIASAMATKPELAIQPPVHIPQSTPTRHKATASLSLLGKHRSNQAQSAPYYEQYNSAASQVTPTTPTSSSPGTEARPQGSNFGGAGGRKASQQMQVKGKDLLHTAGVLGGKGMTGAKGLFAKGKSRLRGNGDKDAQSEPLTSSREASEEPEAVTTPEQRARMSMDFGTPQDVMKKRRFSSLSSPFRHSSRQSSWSRSRPSSIVLPKNAFFDFGTPSMAKGTPPRQTPPSTVSSRPYSYHAPDDWNVDHDPREHDLESTSPGLLPPERLGVLPSPAKSLFSLLPSDQDDVPPVPAIPNSIRQIEKNKESQVTTSHSVLQSIVRYSTPPVGTAGSPESAIFAETQLRTGAHALEGKLKSTNRAQLEDDDQPPQLNHDPPLPKMKVDISDPTPKGTESDVSPMISAAPSTVGGSDDGHSRTPRASTRLVIISPTTPKSSSVTSSGLSSKSDRISAEEITDIQRKLRPAFETEVIGGDVSPISSHNVPEKKLANGDRDAPTPFLFHISPSEITTPLAAPPARPTTSRASSYIVHAIQHVPSHSSFESWEQDALSQSDGSQLGDKHEELQQHDVPPVPLIPSGSLTEDGQQFEQDSASEHHKLPTTQNTSPSRSLSPTLEEAQSSSGAETMPARSQSILSAISSAVSAEGDPNSQMSNQAGRSRPSSRSRQLQGPSVKNTPIRPQIVEETLPAGQPPSVAITNDDYDLYADANGIVTIDGHPLRVPSAAVSQVSPTLPQTEPARVESKDVPKPPEDGPTRYSLERPMSFISGPRDDSGRPQDQINNTASTATSSTIPPVPEIPYRHNQNGVFSSEHAARRQTQYPPPLSQGSQQQGPSYVQFDNHDISPPPGSLRSHQGRASTHSNVSSPRPSNASPPPQPSPGQTIAQRAHLQAAGSRNGAPHDPRMMHSHPRDPRNPDRQSSPDPRSYGMTTGEQYSRDHHASMHMHGQMSAPDSRMQSQMTGSMQPALNPYEQQQMRMQQAMDPRLRDVEYRLNGVGAPELISEKSSSRNKLSSVLKGLGGKPTPNHPEASNQPNSRIDPSLSLPHEPIRSTSYQSSLGDLPVEQSVLKKKDRRSNGFGSISNRPGSVGRESHISHVSQESTKAQATDSRLDLRYPASPPPFKGIPPQHPPPGAPVPPRAAQPLPPSSAARPEGGKKKRFSALGALFGRSKEDKKTQKVTNLATSQPIQPPPAQHWPLQQQQPQQNSGAPPYVAQYGPPQGVRFPGMQGVPPQAMSHQGYLVQYKPVQGPQQYQAQPTRTGLTGSAYMATSQNPQAQQLQHAALYASQQSGQISRSGVSPVPFSQQGSENIGYQPPVGGYFKPDSKHNHMEHGAQHQPQHAPSRDKSSHQVPHARSVSSPLNYNSRAVAPVSQRRVSSPPKEPQYETPQIPAAYNHVSGAYISPGAQSPVRDPMSYVQLPAMHGGMSGRQDSVPQMQPISPQISAPSQPNQRVQSESSFGSVVSPISSPLPSEPIAQLPPSQRPKPTMASISEATQHERPWNLDLPAGATEQEIVRARHHQYMEQQLAAQQQLLVERARHSPSPHLSRHTHSPSPQPPASSLQQIHEHSSTALQGGFREVLPRSSPQPHHTHPNNVTEEEQDSSIEPRSPPPFQPAPVRTELVPPPAAFPLPTSPDPANMRSPVNPLAAAFPPPPPPPSNIPRSPMRPGFPSSQAPSARAQQHVEPPPTVYGSPHPTSQSDYVDEQPNYAEQPPDEPPPSYSGPGIVNDGMDKERPRPPNIVTNAESPVHGRQRQASIGILQHPQPASMAASPQRSSADMGADSLRRQLLEQEERNRLERMQRAELQRAEQERERQEREKARARARELERGLSGGGRVGSLRSQAGRGTSPGWGGGPGLERGGSVARPVFELSAVEDDEPVMHATSFPGQEWVPTFTED